MAIPTISGGIFNFTDCGTYVPPTFSGAVYNLCEGEGYFDLSATISGVLVGETKDLGGYIKSAFQAAKNMGAYTKGTIADYKNLIAAIQGFTQDTADLPAEIVGELLKDTLDLQSIINIIEIKDLSSSITPELFKGQTDLEAAISKIFLRSYNNLGAQIRTPFEIADLLAELNIVSVTNLPAAIKIFIQDFKDLQAYLNIIQIEDLLANIHGFDTRNLSAIAAGVYGPHDLQAFIVGTGGYRQLYAYVRGMLGVEIPYNLPAVLIGTFSSDLPAFIDSITPANLRAYINVTGQADDLPATIIPKVIYMTQVLQVALLEHVDLKAMINSACFGSDSANLYAYIRSIEKLDLQGIIFGWHVDIYSNAKDLRMYINTEDYYVQDKAAPWLFAEDRESYHTRLKITFNATGSAYTVFDTQEIFYGVAIYANLTAAITGILTSVNLGATITAQYDFNFSELPYYISPRTREVVIEFDERWREKWRRFVEIFFDDSGTTPYHYFYVSGANRVYRVDRTRHWTIWAKGFDEVDDSMIERRNVRYKYIFKATQYSNIDEAIRDLIDRVSTYRRANLSARIYGELPIHANLPASISSKTLYRWVKHLRASIVPEGFFDLRASITGV